MAINSSAEATPLRITIGFARENYSAEDRLPLIRAFEAHDFETHPTDYFRASEPQLLAGMIVLHLSQWVLGAVATKLLQQAYDSWLRDPLQKALFSARNKEQPPTLRIELKDSRLFITGDAPISLDKSIALAAEMAELLQARRLEGNGTRFYLMVWSNNGEGHATPDGGDTLYKYYPETKSFIRTRLGTDAGDEA